MTDIHALLRVLPVSGLDTQCIAMISGFTDEARGEWREPRVHFFEPPAGQLEPYVDPVEALTILFRHQGTFPDVAAALATAEYTELRPCLEIVERVRFHDFLEPDSPECVPASVLIALLRKKRLIADDVIDFLERAVAAVTRAPIFTGPDNWDAPSSIAELPDLPMPKAMIEFLPGTPYDAAMDEGNRADPFPAWREEIRPVAERLGETLGEPVYYFADLDCDYDDDSGHRFLALHWWCTYRPGSLYVSFLLEASSAQDIEEFKTALISEESYQHPFKMNDAFIGLESNICRFEYIAPKARKVVGIVFFTLAARTWAESLLLQQINAEVVVVAPMTLAHEEWMRSATRNCSEWTIEYFQDGRLDGPMRILARVDELLVVADEKSTGRGFDLKISESIENLLWRAHLLQVPTKFFLVDGAQLLTPEPSLEARGVPERVAAQDRARDSFTRRLEELRVDCDFGSSGLWNSQGQMLSYDLLSLPFPLVKRLAAWQRDFDETQDPPASSNDAWSKNHERDKREIATELQATLGAASRVKIFCDGRWTWVGDIRP